MSVSQWGRVLVDEIEGTEVPKGELRVWPLGGPSLAVKSSGATILIDPYTGSPQDGVWIRMVAVPYDPADLRDVDAVFSTHEHDDHCHRDTLVPISEHTSARFFGPASSARKMRGFGLPADRIVEPCDGGSMTFGDMTVTAAEVIDHSDPTSFGWVVSAADGPTLFDAGDSMYGPHFAALGEKVRIDATTLAVAGPLADGKKIYMDAQDLVAAAADLRADLLIPKHWDIWRNVAMDPHEVVLAAQAARAHFGIRIPRLGEAIRLRSRG